ncbi:MAG TPA: MgtC/SapB family protein [Tepidisphaeraceae bacterium]|nr:MgtC/SapB family protein [Tepidisphaeraceae bacterium]
MLLATFDFWDNSIRTWAVSLGWPGEGFLRLILAAIAGGLVGIEREVRGRQAGFRTNMLVGIGSALSMVVATQFALYPWQKQPNVNINIDPARLAYAIMVGIGFLGAGTIVHSQGAIRGLTTAAGLWCVAAIGMALGSGIYVISFFATIMVLLALWFLDYVEEIVPKMQYRTISVRTEYHPGCLTATVEHFKKFGLDVIDADFHRIADAAYADINLYVGFSRIHLYYSMESQLESDPKYQLLSMRDE